MEWLERNRLNLLAVLVVLVVVAAATLLTWPRQPALQVLSPLAPMAPPSIKVHVAGSVVSPGVYQLGADARVEDALAAAGGPSDAADVGGLNLATPLKDGQQLLIPQRPGRPSAAASGFSSTGAPSPPPSLAVPPTTPAPTRPAPSPSPTVGSGKLDLNSATAKQLEALPGIGTVTARKILDYREKNGPIQSLEELRDAKVITASMYDKTRELVEAR